MGILGFAVAANAHIAGGDTAYGTLFIIKDFSGGKTRINFHAEFFRLGRQPAAKVTQADDEIAVVGHGGRYRKPGGPVRREQQEMVVSGGRVERRIPVFPVGDQLV